MVENQISRRAKANFPTVLLTLLSIVQALALELMWSHLGDQGYLYAWSFMAVVGWLQILATLLGILLIWLIYSGLVMRFSWVPTTTDAIFPFLVGIVEFAQINTLGPNTVGRWLAILGVLFAAMTWVSQATMRRARSDPDNGDFFRKIAPAALRDHFLSSVPVAILMLGAAVIGLVGSSTWPALLAIIGVILLLARQIWINHVYTERSYHRG